MAKEISWTPAQLLAQRRRGNTLVSAAAGSGKTAALTEKIVRLLTKSGAKLDEMLVVTFSKAAAEELRVKIEKRLLELAAEDPSAVKHLTDLPGAQIGTIHSFCRKVIRENYAEAGVNPGFSVMDSGEEKTVKPRAAEDALDELFAEPAPEADNSMGIAEICDVLGTPSEAALAMREIYGWLRTRGFGAEKIEEYASSLEKWADEDFFSSPWGRVLKEKTAEEIRHVIRYVDLLMPEFDTDEYADFGEKYAEWLEGVEEDLEKGYEGFKRAYTPFHSNAPTNKTKNRAADRIQTVKRAATASFKKTVTETFALTQEQLSDAMRRTARFVRGLGAAVAAYEKRYSAIKSDRGKLDYQDLESIAYRVLVGEDGAPTEAAKRIGQRYPFIFIDEYQDTNTVQDAIFRAVGAGSERFLVGDVKQSIYGFRNAEPEIFTGYREAWPTVLPDGDDEDVTEPRDAGVFMSENFRCAEPVIGFVNCVSRYMFKKGGVPFGEEDELVFRANISASDPVTVCLVSEEGLTEAELVAKKIRSMTGKDLFGKGPLAPSDFAILLPAANVDGPEFAAALAAEGIPSSMAGGSPLQDESEIVLALDMLRAIDNPYRDGPLMGMMFSSIYGFTLDDLVRIRRKYSGGPFFTAVRRTADEGGDDRDADIRGKCAAFCDRLDGYRLAARSSPADTFVDYLFSESGIMYAREVTEKPYGVKNLRALLDLARRYEDGVFGGLYGFLTRIDDLIETDSFVASSTRSGAVNIMTVHKSKGLEFPVCFFGKTGKQFNDTSLRSQLLFDRELGVGVHLPDSGGYTVSRSLIHGAIKAKLHSAMVLERMRMIYVALTRAQYKLFITGKCDPERKIKAAEESALCDDAYVLHKAACPLDIMLAAALKDGGPVCEIEKIGAANEDDGGGPATEENAPLKREPTKSDLAVAEARKNFEFEYPYSFLSGLPSKLAVSALYPEVLDSDGAATLTAKYESHDGEAMPYPTFMTGTFDRSPAKRGTANHVFMQFADFERLRAGDVSGEIERLVTERFITREMADLVDVPLVGVFASSDLSRRIAEAVEVRREFRFNVRLPAYRFTADETTREKLRAAGSAITVQGVFDCVFREADGKLVLIDYKTDAMTDRDRSHTDEFRNKLIERHRLQLAYYKEAAGMLFGRVPDEVLIWSLSLGDTVDLTDVT